MKPSFYDDVSNKTLFKIILTSNVIVSKNFQKSLKQDSQDDLTYIMVYFEGMFKKFKKKKSYGSKFKYLENDFKEID